MIDVDSINAHIFENFPAKGNRYEIIITGPSNVPDMPQSVCFQCNSVQIPGRNLDYTMQKKYGIGLQTPVVDSKTFAEFTLTFYESEFEKERRFFVDWMNLIHNPETNRMNFYVDYVKDLVIIQYNLRNEVVYRATVEECIPVNLSLLERGYAQTDNVPQFSVVFRFKDLKEEFFERR